MDERNLISNYEMLLLHKTDKMQPMYFKSDPAAATKNLIILYKYIVEHLLYMNPKEAAYYLSDDLMEKFHLKTLTDKYFELPSGLPNEQKYQYIMSCCYPTQVHFSQKDLTISIYEKVLKYTLNKKNAEKSEKFPKDFFEGIEGSRRACICLSMMLSRYVDGSPEELYRLFSERKKLFVTGRISA